MPDVEPWLWEIWEAPRTVLFGGHRLVRMCLVHEFGTRNPPKPVLGVCGVMGREMRHPPPEPGEVYMLVQGRDGRSLHNLLKRDFDAARPISKHGTDVTELRSRAQGVTSRPCTTWPASEIVAWDESRSPDLVQQRRLLAMLAELLPAGAEPILALLT